MVLKRDLDKVVQDRSFLYQVLGDHLSYEEPSQYSRYQESGDGDAKVSKHAQTVVGQFLLGGSVPWFGANQPGPSNEQACAGQQEDGRPDL